MKKTKYKTNRILILVAFLLFLIIGIYLMLHPSKGDNDTLSNIGYSKEEIQAINSLHKDNIAYIENNEYISNLIDIIKNSAFKEKNLKKYIELNSLTNLELDNVIYIVNMNYEIKDTYTNEIVAIMKEEYFIEENIDRYINYMNSIQSEYENTTDLAKAVVTNVNSGIDVEFYESVEDTDISKGTLMLVNKYHKLSPDYVPSNLVTVEAKYGRTLQMDKTAYEAFKRMWQDATKKGLSINVRSPYRSYATQKSLYERYASVDGYDEADTYSARAGYSEHQTGLAVDVVARDDDLGNFENTKEFEWMKENAHKYGFILRYPKGKEYLTGYMYESWHYRYVGVDVATDIYNKGITFEEYYAYYIEQK